jgi:hypothetical protein
MMVTDTVQLSPPAKLSAKHHKSMRATENYDVGALIAARKMMIL